MMFQSLRFSRFPLILILLFSASVNISAIEAWRFVASGSAVTQPLVFDDGDIVFGADDGNIYRVGAEGRRRWRVRVRPGPTENMVALHDGAVVVELENGTVKRIAPGGGVAWRLSAPDEPLRGMAASNLGAIYLTYEGGGIRAVNFAGRPLWAISAGASFRFDPIIGPDGNLHLVTDEQELLLISPDGETVRSFRLEQVPDHVALSPDGSLVFATSGGVLYSVDVTDGTLNEIHEGAGPLESIFVDAEGVISIFTAEGTLYPSFATISGSSESEMTSSIAKDALSGAALIDTNRFVVAETEGRLRVIDETGASLITIQTQGMGELRGPRVGSAGHVAVTGSEWITYSFRVSEVSSTAWRGAGGSGRGDGRVHHLAPLSRREALERVRYRTLTALVEQGGSEQALRVLDEVEPLVTSGDLRGLLTWVSYLLIDIAGVNVGSQSQQRVPVEISSRAYRLLGRVGDRTAAEGLVRAAARVAEQSEVEALMEAISLLGYTHGPSRASLIHGLYSRAGGEGTAESLDIAFLDAAEALFRQGEVISRGMIEQISHLPSSGVGEVVRERAEALNRMILFGVDADFISAAEEL